MLSHSTEFMRAHLASIFLDARGGLAAALRRMGTHKTELHAGDAVRTITNEQRGR